MQRVDEQTRQKREQRRQRNDAKSCGEEGGEVDKCDEMMGKSETVAERSGLWFRAQQGR